MRRYTLGLGKRSFVLDVQELSADRFDVVVGGQHFDVTLAGIEELPTATIAPGLQPVPGPGAAVVAPGLPPAAATPHAPARAAPPGDVAQRVVPARPVSPGGVDALKAPMPGVILEMNVKPGDAVQRGQQVAVLEAMKMHNFIGAPRAGVVAEVCVAVGQAVGHGECIVRFKPLAAA